MPSYCKNCGATLSSETRFCSACGSATGFEPMATAGVPAPRIPLMRVREGRQIAGVCLGFARTCGWDVSIVRVVMAIAAVLTFPVAEVAYLVAWVAMPEEPLGLPANTSAPPMTTR